MTGKPRGRPARSSVVSLYKFLYEADRPLSLIEIASRLPSSGYSSHAYRTRRAHLEAQGVPVKENWTQAERDAAWLWWIGELITLCLETRRIVAKTQDGSPAHGKRRDQLRYEANRDNPPVVRVQRLVDVLEHWTPEIGQTGARHVAGVRFLQEAARAIERDDVPNDVKNLLRDGTFAIRNRW